MFEILLATDDHVCLGKIALRPGGAERAVYPRHVWCDISQGGIQRIRPFRGDHRGRGHDNKPGNAQFRGDRCHCPASEKTGEQHPPPGANSFCHHRLGICFYEQRRRPGDNDADSHPTGQEKQIPPPPTFSCPCHFPRFWGE